MRGKINRKKIPVPKKMELGFDIAYLLAAVVLGAYLIATAAGHTVRLMWGAMALTLAFGDSFHLVPRMMAATSEDAGCFRKALGLGKLMTSITMTLFYLLLWYCGLRLFGQSHVAATMILWGLALIRIVLCLAPQNRWTSETPSNSWGIYRNIPFAVIGAMVAVFFSRYAMPGFPQLRFLWLAILLSFAFYIPVVLWAQRYPKIGMLMLPKTLTYVWIICMGLTL